MNTKTKNNLANSALLLLLSAVIILEWKTGLAVAAVVITFLLCYRAVNRHSKPEPKTEQVNSLLDGLLIYDGILDAIDWD
jgi:hypothetical protein